MTVMCRTPPLGKGEASKFLAMVAHTLTRGNPGNVALLHQAGAIGRCLYRYDANWQRLRPYEYVATTFAAKIRPDARKGRCGVLVPNPYFVIDTARAAGIKRALRLGITALEREAPLHPWTLRGPWTLVRTRTWNRTNAGGGVALNTTVGKRATNATRARPGGRFPIARRSCTASRRPPS